MSRRVLNSPVWRGGPSQTQDAMVPKLTLHCEFDSPDHQDFSVLHGQEVVGRIYSGGSFGQKWWYALNGQSSVEAISLEDAKMKLKEEWTSIRSPEGQASRCAELAKAADKILHMLAIELPSKASSTDTLAELKEHQGSG